MQAFTNTISQPSHSLLHVKVTFNAKHIEKAWCHFSIFFILFFSIFEMSCFLVSRHPIPQSWIYDFPISPDLLAWRPWTRSEESWMIHRPIIPLISNISLPGVYLYCKSIFILGALTFVDEPHRILSCQLNWNCAADTVRGKGQWPQLCGGQTHLVWSDRF